MNNLFSRHSIPGAIEYRIVENNPWWHGKPSKAAPKMKRWPFKPILDNFEKKLVPVTLLRGPRRVGKTTLQNQLIDYMLSNGLARPDEILHIQFDEFPDWKEFKSATKSPVLDIAYWFEEKILKVPFNQLARQNRVAYIFFDEVQNLPSWAEQIKSLVDHNDVRVLVTGSSALHIGLGKESLAGRVSQIDIGPLRLSEISEMSDIALPPFAFAGGTNGLNKIEFWKDLAAHGKKLSKERDMVFKLFSDRGGYPAAQERLDIAWEDIARLLIDTVINRVIQHDLRLGEGKGKHKDPRLLEEVFRMCCRYSGQYPAPLKLAEEIRRVYTGNIGTSRILYYLRFLDQAMLIKLVQPLELRLKRRKGYDKLCLCDHALRSAWLNEKIPLDSEGIDATPDYSQIAGHLIEGVIGYFLSDIAEITVNHYPERVREPEVDFIVTAGDVRIPVEIKYRRRIDAIEDTMGLKRFMEKADNRSCFGLLITRDDTEPDPDPRIVRMPASSLLLLR
ncbi:MAG: ATP-binding protein [Elusimicrobia bacterium]|nr:ATP-binding protein [Elusimicrobiota bacterium]